VIGLTRKNGGAYVTRRYCISAANRLRPREKNPINPAGTETAAGRPTRSARDMFDDGDWAQQRRIRRRRARPSYRARLFFLTQPTAECRFPVPVRASYPETVARR